MSKQQQTAHKSHSKFSQLTFRATGQTSGHRTKYGYDRRGRQAWVTNGSAVCSLSFDLAGPLLSETWSAGPLSGLSVTNGYDHLLRRTNLVLLNSTTPLLQHSLSYDPASRLKAVIAGTNSAGYSYVANSPLISQIFFTNNGSLRMTTTKQYDFLNRLNSISSVPSASSVVSFSYSYNDANQRTRVTLADGSYWRFEYDPLGQVKSGKKYWADGTPVAGQQFEYGFDDIGNRTSTRAGGDQNGVGLRYSEYGANSLNQYTNRDVPGAVDITGIAFATNTVTVNGTQAYRKGEYFWKQVEADNTSAAVYPQITVSSGTSNIVGNVFLPRTEEVFAYDADGNLTSDGHWNYSWDGENRLTAMAANTAAGPQISLKFEYDWRHRRIRKQVWDNKTWSGNATNDLRFPYDGWNLLATLNSELSTLNSFLWGLDISGTPQGAGGVGGLLAVWDSSAIDGQPSTHFATYDGNGNVTDLFNAAIGTGSASFEYGPFGEVIRGTGPMERANTFWFSTKYQDEETDLLYYGYRYYSGQIGRFITLDPFLDSGNAILYSFVENAPLAAVDMLGAYTLLFKGSWTQGETAVANSAFTSAAQRMPLFVAVIDKKLRDLELYYACCPYRDEFRKSLLKLRVMMNRERQDLAGSQNLVLTKRNLAGISAQAMFDSRDNPIWEFQISTHPTANFFTKTSMENRDTIFHEASHYVGTEDSGVPDMENAHTLEIAYNALSVRMFENALILKYHLRFPCHSE